MESIMSFATTKEELKQGPHNKVKFSYTKTGSNRIVLERAAKDENSKCLIISYLLFNSGGKNMKISTHVSGLISLANHILVLLFNGFFFLTIKI